jgi:transcription initiation factor IIE alpha subunit
MSLVVKLMSFVVMKKLTKKRKFTTNDMYFTCNKKCFYSFTVNTNDMKFIINNSLS